MSFTRVYVYPMRNLPYRFLHFPRNRTGFRERLSKTESNVAGILEKIGCDHKMDESLSRTKRTVRDMLFCNQFDYFCTFTFNQQKVNRLNYKECQKKITELFKNYKNRYSPGFQYVIVPEFHKDGAIHFHGMIRGLRDGDLTVPDYIWKRNRGTGELSLVPNTRKYVDWTYYSKKMGYFSCSAVKNQTACAVYVSKYITKDLVQLPKGVRAVMASKGLDRPDLVFDEDDIPVLCEPDWKSEFVWIADTKDHMGIIPEWYGECCSELADLQSSEEHLGEDVLRDMAFFSRMTGSQLKL